MECLIGLCCKDFVMVAADMTSTMSIIVMKTDEGKLYKLSEKIVMACCGESGDTSQFSEYIGKNMQLYKMRNGYEMSPKAAASFTRKNLADNLRSQSHYNVNLLIGGYDDQTGPELYFLDYLASCVRIPYACHGYGGNFAISILDRYHKPNLTEEEAYEIFKKCVREIQKRLLVNLPNFKVQKISKDGIKDLPVISAKNLAIEDANKA